VDDLEMPWDIIAFDSDRQLNGRWKFVLHCAAVEWCFESDWPFIEHAILVDEAVNSLAKNGGQDGATVVNCLLDRFSAKRGKVE
jgi:transcription termination factor NusB